MARRVALSGSASRTWLEVGLAAAAIAIIFVLLRLVVAADRDVSQFVVAGTAFADPATVPAQLHVFEGLGYDGQFAWRLAADPTELDTDRHLGVEIDSSMRVQRIGYPWLAWAASLGQLRLVPWSLVLVNVLAIGVLGAVGSVFALEAGRSRWLGLVFAGVPGFVFTLARDLTELAAGATLVAGVLAARRQVWWAGALLWSYAVLTREQLVIPVAAYGIWRLTEVFRRRERLGAADAMWLVPALAFITWQAVVVAATGSLASESGVGPHTGFPFRGFVESVFHWMSSLDDSPRLFVENGLYIVEAALLMTLVGVALRAHVPRSDAWAKWMVISLVALAVLLTRQVWDNHADLRTLTDLFVLSWIVLILWSRSTVIYWTALLQTSALVVAAALRIVVI